MKKLPIVSTLNQKRIAALAERGNHTISIADAAIILKMGRKEVAKLMARWVERGWFRRIKRGLYVYLTSESTHSIIENGWVIGTKLYSPCYVGALSAAQYWGFCDKDCSNINILSIKKPRNRSFTMNGIHFVVRTVSQETIFGLETVICDGVEVLISDPSRTMIDFLVDPQLGGGIANVIDMFKRYLKSSHGDVELLYDYARKILRGSVYKRLGYLLEYCGSCEFNIIELCKKMQTSGTLKLDPLVDSNKLITRWGLWV